MYNMYVFSEAMALVNHNWQNTSTKFDVHAIVES